MTNDKSDATFHPDRIPPMPESPVELSGGLRERNLYGPGRVPSYAVTPPPRRKRIRNPLALALAVVLLVVVAASTALLLVGGDVLQERADTIASQRDTIAELRDDVETLSDTNDDLLADLGGCRQEAFAWQDAAYSITTSTQAWLDAFPYGPDIDLSEAEGFISEAHTLDCI